MAPVEPPADITVKVKVPPGYLEGDVDQFAVGSFPVASTVGALRTQIQQVVPTHPLPERQRLLYGGRPLDNNEQTLADALNTKRDASQMEYVLHLLVKAEGVSSGPASGTANGAMPHVRGTNRAALVAANSPLDSDPRPQPPVVDPAHSQHLQQHHRLHQQHHQQHLQHQHAHRLAQHQQFIAQQIAQQHNPFMMQLPPGVPRMLLPNRALDMERAGRDHQAQAGAGVHGVGVEQTQQHQQQQQQNVDVQANGGAEVPAQPQQSIRVSVGGQPNYNYDPTTQLQQPDRSGANATNQNAQSQQQNGQQQPLPTHQFHFEGHGIDGLRFQVHQHTLNLPHMGGHLPQTFSQQIPGGFSSWPPNIPRPTSVPTPIQNARHNGVSLDPSLQGRFQENISRLNTLIDELGATLSQQDTVTDQERVLEEMRTIARDVEHPLQPFDQSLRSSGVAGHTAGRRSTSPRPSAPLHNVPPGHQMIPTQLPPSLQHLMFQQMNHVMPSTPSQSTNTQDVTCYLLSDPQGPYALIFSPQHGTYTSRVSNSHLSLPSITPMRSQHFGPVWRPTPTPTTQHQAHQPANTQQGVAAAARQQDPVEVAAHQHVQAAAQAAQAAQAAPVAQDPVGLMQPILGHLWLLFRILIFAYFLLGANLGWQRPLILVAIGLAFWMVRAGLMGDGGALRAWWDGIMQVPQAQGQAPGGRRGENDDRGAQPPQNTDNPPVHGGAGQRQRMPTPEHVAQRLLDEQETRNRQRRAGIREYVRPVERAMALFFASLWPGVGEAHVRAREEEQRRLQEEEVERGRREEEANRLREQAEADAKRDTQGEASSSTGGSAKADERADATSSAVEATEGGQLRNREKAEVGGGEATVSG